MDPEERERQLKLLRDQVALLISRNLELQRQVEELQREKAEMAVEAVAAGLVRALNAAEAAMAAEAPEGRRYMIPELQVMLRGFLVPRDQTVVLRLPRPEQSIAANQLGSIQMTVTQVPPLVEP